MIGTGLCALAFAACAADPPGTDDPATDESLSTGTFQLTDPLPIPPDSQPLSADPDPANPDIVCKAFWNVAGGECPLGYTCLWQDNDFKGEIVGVSRGCFIPDLTKIPCALCDNATFNDQMSSWHNHTNLQSCWWFDIHRSGARIVMPAGEWRDHTSPGNNDQASSFGTCF
jgi:hypothetical protein